MKRALLISAVLALSLGLAACDDTPSSAPVFKLGTKIDSASGVATVREGDTLWRISQRYRLPLRDIIDMNKLSPPYPLALGQRILLPPPMDYKVQERDTLHGVARTFGVSVSQLVRVNKLAAPYRLRIGQVLRIPSSTPGAVEKKQKIVSKTSAPPSSRPAVPPPPGKTIYKWMGETRQQVSSPSGEERNTPPVVISSMGSGKFIWPVKGKVVSSYGPKDGGLYNDGINIAAPRGTPVVSSSDGVVAYVGNALGSYGNLVLIRHGGGMVTAYAHLEGIKVKEGSPIKRGQVLGTVGSTGTVGTSQLHFEVRRGKDTLDPRKYIG